MSSRLTQIFLLAGAVVLIVVLLLAPQLPPEKRKLADAGPLEVKINEAVHLVQEGENPMQGILLLQEVLREDSTNARAHWHMAMFSIQSGQIDKAVERFEKVLKYGDKQEYKEAYFWLGQIELGRGHKEQGMEYFDQYLALETDTIIKKGVMRIINDINTNTNNIN